MTGTRRLAPVLLASVGIGALLAFWVLAGPPMAGSDEPAHLIRAVAAAEGQWRGGPPPPARVHDTVTANTRTFRVPDRLGVSDNFPCFVFHPSTPASCTPIFRLTGPRQPSHVGTYYPLLYVPLGAAALLAPSVTTALYAARSVAAVICGGLLLAAFVMVRATAWRRAAWLCAVGPLTFFLSSVAATNGMEVAASIAFVAALLALSDGREGAAWAVAAVSGVTLASARATGPVFIGFDIAAVLLVTGWGWVRTARVPFRAAAVVIAAAMVLNLAWTASQMHTAWAPPVRPLGSYLSEAVRAAATGTGGFYGPFGWLDAPTPAHAVLLGVVAFLTAVVVGAIRTPGWWRVALVAAGAFVITVAVTTVSMIGASDYEARYTLALVAPLPLLAVYRLGDSLEVGARRVVVGLMVAVQAVAMLGFAQRYAVGRYGHLDFVVYAQWSPPGGWVLVLLFGAAGLVAITAAVLMGYAVASPS